MNKSTTIKAVLDARSVPIEVFGGASNPHAITRKWVFVYLASWADPDGTNAYPGKKKIAGDCGVTPRGLTNILGYLTKYRLVLRDIKAGPHFTNRYTVLTSQKDIQRALELVKADAESADGAARRERTREARSEAARRREARKREKHEERSVPCLEGGEECGIPDSQAEVGNVAFPARGERSVPNGQERAVVVEEHNVPDSKEHSVPLTVHTAQIQIPPKTVHPTVPRKNGWLEGRLAALLMKIAQHPAVPDDKAMTAIRKRTVELGVYGDLWIMLAFLNFVQRPNGVITLEYPFRMFAKQCDQWLEVAKESVRQYEDESTDDLRMAVAQAVGYPVPELVRLLCELSRLASMNDDKYDLDVVEQYLATHHQHDDLVNKAGSNHQLPHDETRAT